jgi:hypothetical protein
LKSRKGVEVELELVAVWGEGWKAYNLGWWVHFSYAGVDSVVTFVVTLVSKRQ